MNVSPPPLAGLQVDSLTGLWIDVTSDWRVYSYNKKIRLLVFVLNLIRFIRPHALANLQFVINFNIF